MDVVDRKECGENMKGSGVRDAIGVVSGRAAGVHNSVWAAARFGMVGSSGQ